MISSSVATIQQLELASRSLQLPDVIHDKSPVPLYAMRRLLHEFATEKRVPYYQDPITNDLVATEWLLASLGEQNCHHEHERHCPHFHDGDKGKLGSDDDIESCDETNESDQSTDRSLSSSSASSSLSPTQPTMKAAFKSSLAPLRSSVISPFLRKHSSPLVPSAVVDIEEIRALPRYSQNAKMHLHAVTAGKDCYRDLCTGCLTFTRPFLSQFPCCGEDCRHCPYGHHRGRVQQGPNNNLSSDGAHTIVLESGASASDDTSEDSSDEFSESSSSFSSASES